MLLNKLNRKLTISSICDIFAEESGMFLQLLVIATILPRFMSIQVLNPQVNEILKIFLGNDPRSFDTIEKFSIEKVILTCITMLFILSMSKVLVAHDLSKIYSNQEAILGTEIKNIDLISNDNGSSLKEFLYEKRYKILVSQKEEISFAWQQIAQFLYCIMFEIIFFHKILYSLFILPMFFFQILIYYFFLSREKLKLYMEIEKLIGKRDLEGLILYYNNHCENNLYNSMPTGFTKLKILQSSQQFLKIFYALTLFLLTQLNFIEAIEGKFFLRILFIYLSKNMIISTLSSLQFKNQESSSNLREAWRRILGGKFIYTILENMRSPSDRITIPEIKKISVLGQGIDANISGLNVILKENINFSLAKGEKAALFDSNTRSLLSRILKHIAGRTEKKGFLMAEGIDKIVDFCQLSLKTKNRLAYYSPSMKLPLVVNVKSELKYLTSEQREKILTTLGLQEGEFTTAALYKDLENKIRLLFCLRNLYDPNCDFVFIDGSLFLLNSREDIERIMDFLSQSEKGIVISINRESYIPHLQRCGFQIFPLRPEANLDRI